jgi:hypothetical protein
MPGSHYFEVRTDAAVLLTAALGIHFDDMVRQRILPMSRGVLVFAVSALAS